MKFVVPGLNAALITALCLGLSTPAQAQNEGWETNDDWSQSNRYNAEGELLLKRVLVMDMSATDVSPSLAQNIQEVLMSALRDARPGLRLLGQTEIKAMLQAETKRLDFGCDNTECLAEVGGALGADHMIVGNLGKVGTVFVMTLRVINTRTASVEADESVRVRSGAEYLLDAATVAGHRLVGSEPPARALAALERDANTATTPPGMTAREDDDRPVYKTWWFWTITGAVVAGGATALALTLGGGSPKSSGNVNVLLQP